MKEVKCMVMDKGEILRDYKAAADKTAQVKILADLNACSTEEIIDVLVEQGIERRRLSRVTIYRTFSF